MLCYVQSLASIKIRTLSVVDALAWLSEIVQQIQGIVGHEKEINPLGCEFKILIFRAGPTKWLFN